jgi:5-methylcytosine-specific restriction protein A
MKTLKPRIKPVNQQQLTSVATKRRWLKSTRDRVLKRDRYLCQSCYRAGKISQAVEVDHIVPLHLGGHDNDSNQEGICESCHLLKTANELSQRLNL